jgi:predicted amidohydrolase YtcJ
VSDPGSRSFADLAFVNGAVYTVDAVRSWAQAVAVSSGRIVAVGSDSDIGQLNGPGTEVIDLRGRMLLPGFQDAHVHPVGGGLDRRRCDLCQIHDVAGYLDKIRAYADANPEREWILGGGWSMDQFEDGSPSKELLDSVVPDRKVFLPSRDGHSAWVNSATLELAGVTAATPDPPGGKIQRNERGEPTGTLHEEADQLVIKLLPRMEPDEVYEGLLEGQRYLHSLGITAWQDAIVDDAIYEDNFEAYVRAATDGTLTGRVVGSLWWQAELGREQFDGLEALRSRGTVGRFRPGSIKFMLDGVIENQTASVLTPYLDRAGNQTQNVGISQIDATALKGYVTEADSRGFQAHFHAIGERAVRDALDAIEAALEANGPGDGRHHVAHLQLIHPDDLARFRQVGAVANIQTLWAAHEAQMDELTTPFIGPEREAWQYPFKSLVRAGAALAMGSDWSVSTADPLDQIHVAVNRVMPRDYAYGNGSEEVFLPEERIDLPTALAAFTVGSAFVNHLDVDTGSIEAGKFADLVVLDRNIFEFPADEIGEAKAALTFVEGELVYAAPDA